MPHGLESTDPRLILLKVDRPLRRAMSLILSLWERVGRGPRMNQENRKLKIYS